MTFTLADMKRELAEAEKLALRLRANKNIERAKEYKAKANDLRLQVELREIEERYGVAE